MRVTRTAIPDVLIIEPKVFGDARGFFLESWNERAFLEVGIKARLVHDNHSRLARNVVRGLHHQIRRPQGKLVPVVAGEVFDVAVDIRKSSPTFGKWVGTRLPAENKLLMWIPPRFAHGILALSEVAKVLYKTADFHAFECERCIICNDPAIGIEWPFTGEPRLSPKDKAGNPLSWAEIFP